jgi:Zn-dependent protease with chaperone function
MLFAAALVMSLNLGFLATGFVAAPVRGRATEMRRVWNEVAHGREIDDLSREEARELGLRLAPLLKEELRSRLPFLIPPGLAVLALSVVAALVYIDHPRRVRRRHHAQPLGEKEAPLLVADLCRDVERLGIPVPTLECTPDKGIEGQTFGVRGREVLLLYGRPQRIEQLWKGLVRVMALHEIGHIMNRDAQEREKAKAVWIALMVLLGIALLILTALLTIDSSPFGGTSLVSFLLHNGWKLALMLLVVRAILAGLIRAREYYADWRVVSWGRGGQLRAILAGREHRFRPWEQWGWWEGLDERWQVASSGRKISNLLHRLWDHLETLWSLHPSHELRREVLERPDRLLRISPGLAFVTGILVSLLASNLVLPFQEVWQDLRLLNALQTWSEFGTTVWHSTAERDQIINGAGLRQIFITLFPLVLICFGPFSYLITSALGVQVQRDTIQRLAAGTYRNWGYLSLFQPALLVSLGTEAGFLIAPFHPVSPVLSRLTTALFWLAGTTLLAWLWLAYLRALTRFTLGRHAGAAAPRRLMLLGTLSSAFLLMILLWPAAFSRLTLQSGDGQNLETYLYLFVTTSIYISTLSLIVYLLWCGASLMGVCVSLWLRRPICPTCGAHIGGLAVGAVCDVCERNLAPWSVTDDGSAPLHEKE